MNSPNSIFKELSKIDVSEMMEKTLQKHNYISWVEALRVVLNQYGYDFSWHVQLNDQGLPYFKTDWNGAMVCVSTYIRDTNGATHERSQWHPVITHTNKPIEAPNTMQINTAIQRCLAKSIALHGLGLYIYAGEDLPPTDKNPDREDSTAYIAAKETRKVEKPVQDKETSDTQENRKSQITKWKTAAVKRGLTEDDVEILFGASLAIFEKTIESLTDPAETDRDEFAKTMQSFADSVRESSEKGKK